MCSTDRFGNNAVYEAKIEHIISGKLQLFSRYFLFIPASPQYTTTALRGDNRIPCILHHQHLIANAYAQRSTAGSFTYDNADNGNFEAYHLHYVSCNGFPLSP